MKQLQPSKMDYPRADGQPNFEVGAILILVKTLIGELSQPVTVISGLSELLLSASHYNNQIEKDLMTILKQTDRIKQTLEAVNYVTDYDTAATRRSSPLCGPAPQALNWKVK